MPFASRPASSSPVLLAALGLALLSTACAKASTSTDPNSAPARDTTRATPRTSADTTPPPPPPASVASAPAPASAGTLEPAGAYSFDTEVNGSPVAGEIEVTRGAGTLGGRVTSNAFPEFPISKVAVDGRTMTVTAETPDGPLDITMSFDGASGGGYTGTWSLRGQSGRMAGKRVR